MRGRDRKPKTPQTKKTQQPLDVYKTSAKEFQELLKGACQPVTKKKLKKRVTTPKSSKEKEESSTEES